MGEYRGARLALGALVLGDHGLDLGREVQQPVRLRRNVRQRRLVLLLEHLDPLLHSIPRH